MTFEIYIPTNLTFQDYIAIIQAARVWADGYDQRDHARLLAVLAPEVTIDYTLIVAAWGTKKYNASEFTNLWLGEQHLGLKPLVTQHLLGQPYFKSVTENEIIVQWQQLASHGRKDGSDEIKETSDGRSYMEHRFVRIESAWKIESITPSLLYTTGDFTRIRRAEVEP